MVRQKKPIESDLIPPDHNFSDSTEKISMHRYRVIEIHETKALEKIQVSTLSQPNSPNSRQMQSRSNDFKVEIVASFIGPHP